MQAFQLFEAGAPDQWGSFDFRVKGLPPLAKGFLKERMGLTSMEVSLNELPPGAGLPFLHRHRTNEELYIFLGGTGEFEADGETLPIQPGTCIRCARAVARSWRNTGDEPLRFLVIQAPEGNYRSEGTTTDGEPAEGNPKWIPAPAA